MSANERRPLPHEGEEPDHPPGKPAADDAFARSPGMRVAFGSYESIQVNVDAVGNNVVGDAANEPSIAVNPQNPANMVIGWRQFDTVASNFRQAGWGYTFDGGQSWTFPGVLQPGVFRSDPVLDVDAQGTFYYLSLQGPALWRSHIFRSTNGGVSWLPPVAAHGGDKHWLAIDRTNGATQGAIYEIWSVFYSSFPGRAFTRSVDGGATFQFPASVHLFPTWGTLAVGPGGQVYATGWNGEFSNLEEIVVSTWSDASPDPHASPAFTGVPVNMGGRHRAFEGPNGDGILGQPNVFANYAPGPRRGEVYLLGAVQPAAPSLVPLDPLDVYCVRRDPLEGQWGVPVRVNDDTVNPWFNWQWMVAGAAAPNGRIDAVWLDTRNGGGNMNLAQLFYAYSWSGGDTWSPNVAVTPTFDTSLGYPSQFKMGDYLTIVSGVTAGDVAYTATFNGEQDVYHVRVFPDCDGNGVSDVTDLASPSIFDCDANHVPDGCESAPECLGAGTVLGSLRLGKAAGEGVALQWGAACNGGDDFAVYEGTLGSFATHAPRSCTTGGQTSHLLTPAAGDTYYLVVPTRADREGSYGQGGGGTERPVAVSACLPQQAVGCAP